MRPIYFLAVLLLAANAQAGMICNDPCERLEFIPVEEYSDRCERCNECEEDEAAAVPIASGGAGWLPLFGLGAIGLWASGQDSDIPIFTPRFPPLTPLPYNPDSPNNPDNPDNPDNPSEPLEPQQPIPEPASIFVFAAIMMGWAARYLKS